MSALSFDEKLTLLSKRLKYNNQLFLDSVNITGFNIDRDMVYLLDTQGVYRAVTKKQFMALEFKVYAYTGFIL